MVHAFQQVLTTVQRALRPGGIFILRIPEPEDGVLEAWRDNQLLFTAQTNEPTFNGYVEIGKQVLHKNISEDRFQNLGEMTLDFDYHYNSVQSWWEDVSPGCEDRPQLEELASQLRTLEAPKSPLRVSVRYKEWTILLKRK